MSKWKFYPQLTLKPTAISEIILFLFFSLKVHVNIHKERGIFIKLSYCILKCKKLWNRRHILSSPLLNINLNAFLWTRSTSTPHNNGIRLDIVWFIIVICHVAMSKIRSEQVHNLLWKFLNSIARNVLSLVSFYYKKKNQLHLIQKVNTILFSCEM